MSLLTLTQENFEQEINSPLCFVQFWVAWCGPCYGQQKLLEELSEKRPQIKFALLNAEENSVLADQYEINVFPTVLAFKNGKMVKKYIGLQEIDANL